MAKSQGSPKFYKACCTGEQLTATVDYYRIKPDGTEEKYFTVKMGNAIVVEIAQNTALAFIPDNKPCHEMGDFLFTYSKITWTYNDGDIKYADDWKA